MKLDFALQRTTIYFIRSLRTGIKFSLIVVFRPTAALFTGFHKVTGKNNLIFKIISLKIS